MKNETKLAGVFTYELRRNGKIIDTWEQPNIVPTVGLNHFNDVVLNGASAYGTWYIGLYLNAYTPVAANVYGDIGTLFTEITGNYDEADRPPYIPDGAAVAGVTSNSASRATFTFNASDTVNGALFVSGSGKGINTGGILLAASAHVPARSVIAGDELLVKYEFSGTSS